MDGLGVRVLNFAVGAYDHHETTHVRRIMRHYCVP